MNGSSRGRTCCRAQSSTIGFVLVVGLTLAAATSIVVFGSAALDEGQRDVEINQAEHALTQFDSKAAQVALGDSSSQRIPLGTSGGTYSIDGDAGKVWVVHEDWDGAGADEVVLSGQTLGAITYERGDTVIAYQGGGVWRVDEGGGATMISPPEFHYRAPTLTFPIIRVEGNGSVQGRSTASVERKAALTTLFPNDDRTYGGGSNPYENPVEQGNMTVTIQSEYCEAWRSYFTERTDGEVTECDADDNVTAELITRGQTGVIQNVRRGNELEVRGKDDGPTMRDLQFTLETSESQSSDFANFRWSMSVEQDGKQFEVYLQNKGNNYCGDAARTVVFYNDSGSKYHHAWIDTDEFVFDCSGDRDSITIDLTSESMDVALGELNNDDLEAFDPDTSDFEHGFQLYDPADHPGYNTTYDDGDTETMNKTVQYYLDQFEGSTTIEFKEGNNAGIGSNSEGFIDYDGDDRTVTYLQVTENRIEVRLE